MADFYLSSPKSSGQLEDLARYVDGLNRKLRYVFQNIDSDNFTDELREKLEELEGIEGRVKELEKNAGTESSVPTSLVSPYVGLPSSSSSISGAASSNIYGRQLIFMDRDNRWRSITYSLSQGTGKSVCTTPFRLNSVRYYGDSEMVASGENRTRKGAVYSIHGDVDFRYSANLSGSNILKAGDPVYLVGKISEIATSAGYRKSRGLFVLDSEKWWTQVLPNADTYSEETDKDKVYKQIGWANDDYFISFDAYLPAYKYADGACREWSGV